MKSQPIKINSLRHLLFSFIYVIPYFLIELLYHYTQGCAGAGSIEPVVKILVRVLITFKTVQEMKMVSQIGTFKLLNLIIMHIFLNVLLQQVAFLV